MIGAEGEDESMTGRQGEHDAEPAEPPVDWASTEPMAEPMNLQKTVHVTVMLEEATAGLGLSPGAVVVDGTLGGGGHTRRLAELVGPTGRVIALDADPAAIARTAATLPMPPVEVHHANFRELPEVLKRLGIQAVDGIVLDLGLSSDQLADRERGFSFSMTGPLDLRFDSTQGETASDWLQTTDERELADLIFRYGEERCSRRIAKEIVKRRRRGHEWTASELAELVASCVPRSPKNPIHPATRTFQALRIAVNDELGSLELALKEFPGLLKPSGRLAIISFHSLEDRLVKEAFRDDPRWECLTRKPIRPTDAEVMANPRSRSAKLRIAARRDPQSLGPETLAPKRFFAS